MHELKQAMENSEIRVVNDKDSGRQFFTCRGEEADVASPFDPDGMEAIFELQNAKDKQGIEDVLEELVEKGYLGKTEAGDTPPSENAVPEID